MASSGAGRCNARKQTRRPFFELSVLGAASREATEAFKHFALCFVFGRFCCIFVNQHVYDHCLEAQGWVCEQAHLMHPRLRPIKPAKNAHNLLHQSAHNSFNMSEFIQCDSLFSSLALASWKAIGCTADIRPRLFGTLPAVPRTQPGPRQVE